jgi:hypothetical protein
MPSGHPMDKHAKEAIVNIYKWLIEEGPNQFNTSSLEEEGIYLKIAKMTKLDQKNHQQNNTRVYFMQTMGAYPTRTFHVQVGEKSTTHNRTFLMRN